MMGRLVYKGMRVSGYFRICLAILLMGSLFGCDEPAIQPSARVLEAGHWKQQAEKDIIKPWTQNARDTTYQTFYAYLDRQWQSYQSRNRYPGMLARHIYSYSAAYLMSGKQRHLDMARQTMQYLIRHGWDEKYGLWYNEIDSTGQPVDRRKDLFMQTYAVTGLSLYYIVTHDSTALHYLERSNELLEKHAWDDQFGGYYRVLNRDLSVDEEDRHKDFTPQLAPLSGHLLYLYSATRDSSYLQQARRIFDTSLDHMFKGTRNWIMERFDRDWSFRREADKNRAMNVGHNVETSWLGLRMYRITSDDRYLERALNLADSLDTYAFRENGAWLHRIGFEDPTRYPETTSWWIQAYGNMYQLYLYRLTGVTRYLNQFRKGADFWNQHFVDREYGGSVLSTYLNGKLERGDKAVRSKTSYHSMEHALLNYIYLSLWVQNKSVTLHYHIRDADDGERLFPLPIEEFNYEINEVRVDGEPWKQINEEAGYIKLPEREGIHVTVTLRDKL